MTDFFYKIVDTRTGVTAYVPDYAWKRTRKLYSVMDIGDLAFMERADGEVYVKTEKGYVTENEALETEQERLKNIHAKNISTLTIGDLMDIIYDECRAALSADAAELDEYEKDFYENTPSPGPGSPYSPNQIKG